MDIRYELTLALRRLRQTPLFAAAVITALAIAIAAVTSAFAVVRGVLLAPLPIADQDNVVVLRREHPSREGVVIGFSIRELGEYAATSRALRGVAGVQYDAPAAAYLRDGSTVFPVGMTLVSGNLFNVLGARVDLGRAIEKRDDVVGASTVAVISHSLWLRQFGGDSNVIGRAIRFATSDTAITIVGVMPRGFDFPVGTDVWLPSLAVIPQFATNDGGLYNLVGRLSNGETIDRARAELTTFVARRPPPPGLSARLRAGAVAIQSLIVGDVRPTLFVVSSAVCLVLLIAAVNVGSLFLVRSAQRRREFAVRSSLGATRPRLVRQLMIEASLFAGIACVAGVLLGNQLVHLLIDLLPAGFPRVDDIVVDPIVLAVSGGLALVSSLLFLVWPALVATSRPDLIADLRAGSPSLASGHRANLGARFAVVMQTALALAVLVAALLLGRTLERLQSVHFGYAVDQLVAADVEYASSLQAPEQQAAFYNRVVARLEALPDVSAATVVLDLPYSGSRGWDTFYSTEGQTPAQAAANPSPDYQVVLPDYFTTLGVTILRGRAIEEQDRKGTIPVVVVSDALARRAWPGQDPIGKRINCRAPRSQCSVVVGVAGDTRYRDLRSARPVIYVPWAQASNLQLPVIVARGRNGRLPALSEMRRAIAEVDPRVVITKVSRVDEVLSSVLTRPRFNFLIVSAFASIALLLSAFGTYAILSAFVRQQMPELGIRSALGAAPGQLFRSVITRGLGLATMGLVAGIVITLGLSRLLTSLLYEVSSVDPLTLGASVIGMLAIAIVACWRPAKAASSIDPLRVLRME